jgi:hypothetical protein
MSPESALTWDIHPSTGETAMQRCALLACIGLIGMTAHAFAAPLDYDTDYCALRVYDATHLASHPGQTVTRISLAGLKTWNIGIGRDLPYREPRGALAVTASGRTYPPVPLTCTDYAEDQTSPVEGAYYCRSPCEKGQLIITRKGDELRMRSDGFVAQCGAPSLDDKADKIFILRAARLSDCAIPSSWPTSEDGFHDIWLKFSPNR